MATERLMVAAPLDATEVGQEFNSLPPHMTVFPWFELKASDWPRFDAILHRVVDETVQPTIQGGDKEMFGPQHTTSVRLLNRATRSFNVIHGLDIHAGVLGAVRRYGDNYDPSYVGLNWRPHVSTGKGFELLEDETVTLSELAVFERRAAVGSSMIKAVYKWQGPHGE